MIPEVRLFNSDEQANFAELSGDNNPIHLDSATGRRSLFGRTVVHGIHLLLSALDYWLKDHQSPVLIRSLRVVFIKPVGLGEPVQFNILTRDGGQIKLEAFVDEVLVMRALLVWQTAKPEALMAVASRLPLQIKPYAVDTNKILKLSGKLELLLHLKIFACMFPNAAKWLSPAEAAALLASTRLVGVYCPGLHSIFSELLLNTNQSVSEPEMNYSVESYDKRFGLVIMKILAAGFVGQIKAFIRPQPQRQPTYKTCMAITPVKIFSGQHSLVVGGSRGLGELTAKILSAGGAHVQLTYHLGKSDAERVVSEINAGGGNANCFQLDVLQPDANSLVRSETGRDPIHLYYFATPHIATSAKGKFSAKLFHEFCQYYADGFSKIFEILRPQGLLKVFYPSSVYVEEMPANMAEYATAKATGEALCRFYQQNFPMVHFHYPRLPRLATDQTVSLVDAIKNQDTLNVMTQLIKKFNSL